MQFLGLFRIKPSDPARDEDVGRRGKDVERLRDCPNKEYE